MDKKIIFFKSNSNFINKGISGQTTSEILNRFQNDVINKKPNTVIILAGINDIAKNNGPIKIENIAKNIFKMVELAKKEKLIPLFVQYFQLIKYCGISQLSQHLR